MDGGFVAAAKYLNRLDSKLSVSGALVDVDKPQLEALLGLQSNVSAVPKQSVNSAPTLSNSMGSLINILQDKIKPIQNQKLSNNDLTTKMDTLCDSNSGKEQSVPPATATAFKDASTETAQKIQSWTNNFSKKLSIFGTTSFETLKLKAASVGIIPPQEQEIVKTQDKTSTITKPTEHISDTFKNVKKSAMEISNFVIDEEESLKKFGDQFEDSTTITIKKTELEKAQALALHKLSGLSKGDVIAIKKSELPGAILFPAIKYKEVKVTTTNSNSNSNVNVNSNGTSTVTTTSDSVENSVDAVTDSDGVQEQIELKQVHRFLVVSKERFIVLDSNGEGLGADAVVKSNHHLTEVNNCIYTAQL